MMALLARGGTLAVHAPGTIWNRPLSSTDLVCIVDDDPFVLAATSSLVRSFGWEALTFASASALLASDAVARAGCLVCDVQMPGLDGVDLLERLQRGGARVPTLFITAFASDRVRERVQARGGLCLIEKPVEAAELETWIARALQAGA